MNEQPTGAEIILLAIAKGKDPRPTGFEDAECVHSPELRSLRSTVEIMVGDIDVQRVWLWTEDVAARTGDNFAGNEQLYYRGIGPRGVRWTCFDMQDVTRIVCALLEYTGDDKP